MSESERKREREREGKRGGRLEEKQAKRVGRLQSGERVERSPPNKPGLNALQSVRWTYEDALARPKHPLGRRLASVDTSDPKQEVTEERDEEDDGRAEVSAVLAEELWETWKGGVGHGEARHGDGRGKV